MLYKSVTLSRSQAEQSVENCNYMKIKPRINPTINMPGKKAKKGWDICPDLYLT